MSAIKTVVKTVARTRVTTVICPQCSAEMYSRAHYDFHGCKCGTFVDGGFDYLRYGWPNGYGKPATKIRYVPATKVELYHDWNNRTDKFGFIGTKPEPK